MNKIKKKRTIIILVVSIIVIMLCGIFEVKRYYYSNQIEDIFSQCVYNYGNVNSKYISNKNAKKISNRIRKKNTWRDFELKKLEVNLEKTNWRKNYTEVHVDYYAKSGDYKGGESECYKCYFEIKDGKVYIKEIEYSPN